MEGTLKVICFQALAMDKDTFHYIRLLQPGLEHFQRVGFHTEMDSILIFRPCSVCCCLCYAPQ